MAIIDVGLHLGGVEGEQSVSQDGKREDRFSDVYKAISSDGTDTRSDVLEDSRIPQLFEAHPEQIFARVVGRRASWMEEGSSRVWLVTVTYSTLAPPESESKDEDPLKAPVEISSKTITKQINPTKDLDDKAMVNVPFGEPFETPLEVTQFIDVATFVRNEYDYTLAKGRLYRGKVNSAAIINEAAGTVLCSNVEAQKILTHDPPYWRVTYEFQVDPEGWQPKVLNASYYGYSDGGAAGLGIVTRFQDSKGFDKVMPTRIDEGGLELAQNAASVYLTFRMYGSVDFNALGLPFAG